MTAINKTTWAAILLVSISAGSLRAQDAFSDSFGTSDLQFFAPVDFDFENQPIGKSSGYFFRYDKLSWAATGERTTVGDPDEVVLSEIIYRLADDPTVGGIALSVYTLGTPVPQYVIENGLQNIALNTAFGWGERYEFGQMDNGQGWSIGILDGPKISQSNTYGSGPQTSGFGSIHINFVTPPDYLRGFRNYTDNGDNEPGTVVTGPGGTGSGVADDLDGDLIEAVNVLDAGGPVAIITDFDDSSLFNVRFNQLTVRNTTESQGIELMRSVQLDNRHKLHRGRRNQVELAAGVRFLRLRDEFALNGTSDLFKGLNTMRMRANNQIVGPQVRGNWSAQRGRWNLDIDSRFVFGYNIQDLDQGGTWGENMVTGEPNAPEVAQPTTFAGARRDDDFSPLVEVRVNAAYQITHSIAVQLGYTGTYVGNISRASQLVRYRLPDWGIGAAGQQDIFINGANFGFNVVY